VRLSAEELSALVEEQAALRRVAMLVARGTRPEDVFAAVLDEVGRLFRVDLASICRYEADGTLSWVANWGRAVDHFSIGSRLVLGGQEPRNDGVRDRPFRAHGQLRRPVLRTDRCRRP
jgi:GAF domain-containing protein